jgi:hypothetical protein
MDKHNCGNCEFFISDGENSGLGRCHKYVPQVIPTTTVDVNFGHILVEETAWPQVTKNEWCGEWEAKMTEKVK